MLQLSAENEHLREALLRAEVSRLETLEGLESFSSRFNLLLATYRGQRAWRVMLLLRKWYVVVMRGNKSPLFRALVLTPAVWVARAIGFVAAKVAGGLRTLPIPHGRPLDLFELEFPALSSYLTQSCRLPYTGQELTPQTVNAVRIRRNLGEVPAPEKYDIVVLPIFHFDFRFQRPQQVASHFARDGHRVFWICPSMHLPPDSPTPYRLTQRAENLWEVTLRGEHFNYYQEVLPARQLPALLESVSRLYDECGIAENCVLVEWSAWRPLALALREGFGARILYDCMDNWDTFSEVGEPNILEERRLVEDCDALVVTASALVRKFSSAGRRPALIRNAADFAFFREEPEVHVPLELSGPVIGYFGAIADWTDLEIVLHAARGRPQYTFVLVGQNHDQDLSRLAAQPNVRILGQRPYQEMPSYLRQFDVCLIPFRLNHITNATDPVKVYEYFSLGKPVVATAMAELEALGDLLYLARGRDEFLERLDAAVYEDSPDLRAKRVEFAAANTWPMRVQAMDSEIRKCFPLVSILIVTHQSREYVRPCLDSVLLNTAWPNYEVILVDNASTDGTAEILRSYAGAHPRIRFFPLDHNSGFAGGNNFAARQALGEDLIFLNADTIVTSGWVERLRRPARRDPAVGMVVAVTNFAGNEAKINADYRNAEEMQAFATARARECAGATLEVRVAPLFCALIPRPVWRELGELDQLYTVGMFEDDDYSLRARRAGYRLVTAEDCFVHHFGQGSFAKLDPERFERIFARNRERFEKRWGEPWQPHQYRPGIRPAHDETRYTPEQFCRPASPAPERASEAAVAQ
ncbi:MAG: glycosyltransferase [Acidobacteria bacterium]|nr:glycosyltransferase [Acidobacteriota bacterium]